MTPAIEFKNVLIVNCGINIQVSQDNKTNKFLSNIDRFYKTWKMAKKLIGICKSQQGDYRI
jgi:hypothetical protein